MPTPSEPGSHRRPISPQDTFSLENQATLKAAHTGTVVFGRYELIRVLGRGGMGVVWLAFDTKLEREVALKFLPDVIGTDPVALGELKSETRKGLELAHPNIVRIYDFLDDQESAAISMEFVDGKTLAESRLAQPNRVFAPETLAPWVVQICDALDYAHQQKKIVHRDLKPANFMLGKDQNIRITDFGIARSVSDTLSRLTAHHHGTSGTLLYMSPQQAMGEMPSATDDIYSLGATLYELLTGKPPFYTGDITLQVSTKVPPSIKQRREELGVSNTQPLPAVWEKTLAACLEKSPEARPQSAAEVLQLLELSNFGKSVGQRQWISAPQVELSPLAQSSPNSKFSKLQWQWWLLPILALLMGGIWFGLFSTPESSQPPEPLPASVTLLSDPPGATFILAGKTHTTPATIEGLPAGVYQPELKLLGYATERIELDLRQGEVETLPVIKLRPSTGKLTLASTPEAAHFRITSLDREDFTPVEGTAPATFDLLPGEYQIDWTIGMDQDTTKQVITADHFYSQNFTLKEKTLLPELPTSKVPSSPLLGDLTPLNQLVPAPTYEDLPKNTFDVGPPGLPLPIDWDTINVEPWPIEQIFVFSKYHAYSLSGRQHLVYLVQDRLKKAGLYNSSLDGQPGRGTHLAIQAFQSEQKLTPTGLLDDSTLAALGLDSSADLKDWAASRRPARPKTTPEKDSNDGWWNRNVGGFMKRVFTRP